MLPTLSRSGSPHLMTAILLCSGVAAAEERQTVQFGDARIEIPADWRSYGTVPNLSDGGMGGAMPMVMVYGDPTALVRLVLDSSSQPLPSGLNLAAVADGIQAAIERDGGRVEGFQITEEADRIRVDLTFEGAGKLGVVRAFVMVDEAHRLLTQAALCVGPSALVAPCHNAIASFSSTIDGNTLLHRSWVPSAASEHNRDSPDYEETPSEKSERLKQERNDGAYRRGYLTGQFAVPLVLLLGFAIWLLVRKSKPVR